jgi:hypothetical protein
MAQAGVCLGTLAIATQAQAQSSNSQFYQVDRNGGLKVARKNSDPDLPLVAEARSRSKDRLPFVRYIPTMK